MRYVARGLRGIWVAALHPIRRWSARRRIQALPRIRNVVVVCTGNVCRSPFAEAWLREHAPPEDPLQVVSAGLMGSRRPSPTPAQLVAGDRGLDLHAHRSRLFSIRLATWADLVIVMDRSQRSTVLRDFTIDPSRLLILPDLDTRAPARRRIPDPFGHSRVEFEQSYDQIERCLRELLGIVRP